MMIQAQLDLEREATARRQAKRIKELRKTRQPSQRVSTSRTKRYDSDDFVSRTETEEGELEDDEWLTDDEDDETGKLKKRFKNPAPSKSKKKQKKGAKGAIHDDGDEHEFIDRLRSASYLLLSVHVKSQLQRVSRTAERASCAWRTKRSRRRLPRLWQRLQDQRAHLAATLQVRAL